jgi:SPP1 gp7 family putative phage head morphogenesis protein
MIRLNLLQRLNRKRRKLRKPPKWLFPKPMEREYLRGLLELLQPLEAAVEEILLPELARLEREVSGPRPDGMSGSGATPTMNLDLRRQDDWVDDVPKLMQMISLQMGTGYEEGASALAIDIGQKTSRWNSAQWQRILKAVLGADVFRSEPWLAETLKGFGAENVALIKSIRDQSVRKIEGMTMRALQAGTRHEQLAKDIREEYGNGKKRAALIARDQVAKLNGNLTMLRQKNAGVKHYVWRTSMDERVRPSHAALEGKEFAWTGAPAPPEGHPGQPIQCFPGDSNLMMALDGKKLFRRWYSGPLTTIITASGELLRATPNHPVLTSAGWKPIQFINEGEYLIAKMADERGVADVENSIPSIEQIFNSFAFIGAKTVSLPGFGLQFHGDGTDKEVQIIDLDSFLPNMINATADQKITELLFPIANCVMLEDILLYDGIIHPIIKSFGAAPDCFMRGASKLLALFGTESAHPKEIRLAAIARIDAALHEAYPNGSSCSAMLLGNGLFTDSSEIIGDNRLEGKIFAIYRWTALALSSINAALPEQLAKAIWVAPQFLGNVFEHHGTLYHCDRVVNKFSREFSDHVFNLETEKGWFCSKDNQSTGKSQGIIVGNCRCTSEPSFKELFEEMG